MKKNVRKKQIRALSIVTTLVMIYSMLVPGFAGAQSKQHASVSMKNSNVSAEEKLSNRLMKQYTSDEKVTFLIKFKEKADTMKAAQKARSKAQKTNLSVFQQEIAQRSAVIAELKTVAHESQANVKEYLEQEAAKGNAENIREYYIVNGIAVTATKEVAEKIASFPEVEKILPNEKRQLIETVETSEDAPVTPASVEWNVDRIHAPDVWGMGIDGTGAVVASIDTGVQWDHPALMEKYRGYNPATGEVDHTYSFYDPVYGETVPHDIDGHGTHVTGTMVGSEPDGSNQVGVAPGAKWISVQAFTPEGAYDADLLAAAEWIMAPGGDVSMAPDVVNNSWGGGPGLDEWYRDTVIAWRAAGIFPVFAAGNTSLLNPGGPGSVVAPANYPESFAVGATDSNDEIASFSLRGPSPYDEIKPDISAPGVNIRSSVPENSYDNYNGTSMATPAVAGVVALLRSADSSLTVDEMEDILINTATPKTDSEYPDAPNNAYGHGLVDAFSAVSTVADGLGTIQGHVLKEGEDEEAPTFYHEPVSETYAGVDLELTVEASDNISVTSVELNYQKADGSWNTVEATRTSGDYLSGEYTASIPGEELETGSLIYNWTIHDFGNNEVVSDDYSVDVLPGITNGYSEDFETTPIGWYSFGQNSTWEWGVPSSGPGEAVSGEKVYATNLDGDYENTSDATLVMPPIELPAEEESYLQFKNWHNFELGSSGTAFDYGQVLMSQDLEEWTELQTFEGTSDGWESVEVDLSDYQGERVYIGFKVYSDGSVTREGWYLDDVSLSETSMYDNDTVPPTFEHTPPGVTYEGMNLHLQVQVSDDVRVGSVTLHYKDENDEWQELAAELVDGGGETGEFNVTVPGDQITGDSFTYKWLIHDYAGNEVESEEYVLTVEEGVTIGYFEDFESTPTGWQSFGENNVWEWGTPASGPDEAVSGENVYATNLDGEYVNRMDAYLLMPAVNVPEGDAYLQFKSWHDFEQSSSTGRAWDYGYVVVSTDQENWDQLLMFQGESDGWEDVIVDLSEYSGQRIMIGFYAYSDGSITREGWYIDDVELTDQPDGEPSAPDVKTQVNTATKDKKVEKTEPAEQNMKEDADKAKPTDDPITINGLPLSAQVTVLETGRSVSTNPADGTYSLIHTAGDFTVKAETYGFASQEQTVTVEEDAVSEVNFTLEELPQSTISGTVTNAKTGEPIEGATVLVVEDANVEPVATDSEGSFALTGYHGDYTLRVMARDYHSQDMNITLDGDLTLDIELEPFYTIPGGEIGYDDGTAENARAYYDAGNAWAVKMSLPEGKESAIVTEGVFQFYDTEWPDPGDTPFAVEVWSAGEDGMPDEKLAGPIEAEAIRDLNQWTVVDLREHNIQVNGDFFMVYVQTADYPNVPGLATDEDGTYAGRSYERVGGSWAQTPADEGNYMIRARVAYEVESPIITSPEDGLVTNEETITVEGTASPATELRLLNNGEEVGSTEIDETGEFAFDTDLNEGMNEFTAVTLIDGEEAKSSEPITVILDTIAPDLILENPEDGDKINRETVTVEGRVSDKNLDAVLVNGQETEILEDGTFAERILLDEGQNVIEVSATDLAGNETTKTITVDVDFTPPVIENLMPEEDQHLEVGDTVMIEFDSEPGLEATYSIYMPLTNLRQELSNAIELPMMETSEGHYVGYWTVPGDLQAEGAVIEVKAVDDYGNETRQMAEGKLYISEDDSGNDNGNGKGKGKGKNKGKKKGKNK